MKSFLSLSALMAVASATVGLLVPMYEYPYGDDALADWNALITAVDAHPAMPFYIIININSGAPYFPNPPSGLDDFAVWIDALNSRSNAKSIGYIHTESSSRDSSVIIEGVTQYLNWTTSAGRTTNASAYNVQLDGIFFDEIDTDPTKLAYNTKITEFAKSAFEDRGGPIVLNPGTLVQAGSESLFDIADSIVQMETCYTNSSGATDPDLYERCAPDTYTPFTPDALSTLGNETVKAKSSVIVHDFYESWEPYAQAALASLQEGITAAVSHSVHSFYFSLLGYTGNFTLAPASIINVATYAAHAQNLR
ncbi:spherulin 4-like cell surface [Grosmannia clavigera kw1407]|uniref:Spherulin 4-like cell surface n=1 Tax=Grosmannia clavigera (strain kw1407 / UAMH 11150) TaxID=655863 RepID=F0XKN9_GROCL|nr:spherulin 4-like cell surface [Grosmannia clavigera kw1407]EFX01640.1 spherulin 4-like cell surface [Grosmannia clavigera kw1407]